MAYCFSVKTILSYLRLLFCFAGDGTGGESIYGGQFPGKYTGFKLGPDTREK